MDVDTLQVQRHTPKTNRWLRCMGGKCSFRIIVYVSLTQTATRTGDWEQTSTHATRGSNKLHPITAGTSWFWKYLIMAYTKVSFDINLQARCHPCIMYFIYDTGGKIPFFIPESIIWTKCFQLAFGMLVFLSTHRYTIRSWTSDLEFTESTFYNNNIDQHIFQDAVSHIL